MTARPDLAIANNGSDDVSVLLDILPPTQSCTRVTPATGPDYLRCRATDSLGIRRTRVTDLSTRVTEQSNALFVRTGQQDLHDQLPHPRRRQLSSGGDHRLHHRGEPLLCRGPRRHGDLTSHANRPPEPDASNIAFAEMPVVVALAVVVVVVTVVVGLIVITLAGLGRHRSRTRDQASTIFTLRTAVGALVQAATQGYDIAAGDGQGGERRRIGTPWMSVDSTVRPTVKAQLPLIQDGQLRQLTNDLLEITRQLGVAAGTEEGLRLCREVDSLHGRFRTRSNEIVRELNLRRLPRA